MKLNKDIKITRTSFLVIVVTILFFAALLQVSSQVEKVKYTDLEIQNITEEGNDLLEEYYGEFLGYITEDPRFNTVATADSIAILNITIDGKDKRIFTRLNTGILFPAQSLANTINLVVLGNISLKGILFSEVEDTFGPRRLFGIESTTLRYTDEGFSRLVNGKANVSINPILKELISTYNVFLSAGGLTRGIYVSEKTDSYFVVKSVNSNSNVAFSWMLRGARKDYDEGYLISRDTKGMKITATINFESGSTEVKINGLGKILALVNGSNNNLNSENNIDNTLINGSNNNTNQTNGQGIALITGNLIDEFGLETDLGAILGEATPLPNLTGETATVEENITANETVAVNETAVLEPEISDLEFTLYSTNEEFIMEEVSFATGLSFTDVKKLINFVYAGPEGFEDEVIEDSVVTSLDFIEKINGSVRIRLG